VLLRNAARAVYSPLATGVLQLGSAHFGSLPLYSARHGETPREGVFSIAPMRHNMNPSYFSKMSLMLSYALVFLVSSLFLSGLPTNTLYGFLSFPIHAACPAHVILLHLIILIVLGEQYKL
jgi:hypothetical protein